MIQTATVVPWGTVHSAGMNSVKVEPSPTTLETTTSPPISRENFRQMASPSPVPHISWWWRRPLFERLKQPSQLFRTHADAGVGHDKANPGGRRASRRARLQSRASCGSIHAR